MRTAVPGHEEYGREGGPAGGAGGSAPPHDPAEPETRDSAATDAGDAEPATDAGTSDRDSGGGDAVDASSDPPADPSSDPAPPGGGDAVDASSDPPADPSSDPPADPSSDPAPPGGGAGAPPTPPSLGRRPDSGPDADNNATGAGAGARTDPPPDPPPPPAEASPPPHAFPSLGSPSPSSSAGTGRGTVAAIAAAVAAAAFLAGFAAAGAGIGAPDSTTNDDLAAMIEGLRGDLAAFSSSPGAPAPAGGPRTDGLGGASPAEFLSDDDPAKGDPGAPLTIVEFSDFQCPFCGRFYEQTLPLLEENYIDTGKVRLVYRDMPLEIHPQAPPAHIAAECADEQGMFWEYHDLLFDRQGEWSRLAPDGLDAALAGYADELGLDGSFAECVRSPEAEREMQADYAQARGMGLTGTPTFLIGGNGHDFVAVSGAQPYSTFVSILDGML